MSLYRKLFAGAVGACLVSATGVALAAHAEIFEDEAAAPARPAAISPLPQQPAAHAAPPQLPEPAASAAAPAPEAAPEPSPTPRSARSASSANVDRELECLAKIVVHEAGNQSRAGQLAVAQVVMNRVRSPRFPNTICGVAMQPGQFFNVHRYTPPRDARWRRAVEIARDARDGVSEPVVGNALFFRAAYADSAFFRSRTRVATLGDHVFYR